MKMGFCSQFKALFKKNFMVWYRNLCGSLCELIFPVILMLIIVLVRNLISDEDVGARSYLGSGKFSYYYDQATQLHLGPDIFQPDSPDWLGLSRGAPFASCIYFQLRVVAFVGDTTVTQGLWNQLSTTGRVSS